MVCFSRLAWVLLGVGSALLSSTVSASPDIEISCDKVRPNGTQLRLEVYVVGNALVGGFLARSREGRREVLRHWELPREVLEGGFQQGRLLTVNLGVEIGACDRSLSLRRTAPELWAVRFTRVCNGSVQNLYFSGCEEIRFEVDEEDGVAGED